MHVFIKKNQKKLMAIFAVVLMVAFLIPTVATRGQRSDRVSATVFESQPVYASELAQARGEWERLKSVQIFNPYQYGNIPIVYRLGQSAVEEINRHPELFCLLQVEARDLGITVTDDQVETLLKSDQVRLPAMNDISEYERTRSALAGLLLIENGFERIASNVKISNPLGKRLLAQNFQEIKVGLVEFPVAEYTTQVKAPTTQQVQEQFAKWSQVEPTQASTRDNPYGVGYKYPNRVKLQYITVKHDDVKHAVLKSKSDQEWAVTAFRYYRAHPELFPTTAPSTTKPSPPTTRPFEQARTEAIDAVVEPQVEKLSGEILGRLMGQLNTDYAVVARTLGAAAPTTLPVASNGAAYNSFDYLQNLAIDVQKQFGVLPTVSNIDQWQTRQQASELPGIGQATVDGRAFADQAVVLAAPFFNESDRTRLPVTNLWQPSNLAADASRNRYVFRLTAARPAEVPTDVSQVAAKVTEDLLKESSLRVARAAAISFIDQSKKTSIADAATADHRKVITPGYLSVNAPTIEGYALDAPSLRTFLGESFRMLTLPRGEKKMPMTTIDLPSAGKVLAVQLDDVRPTWTPQTMASVQWEATGDAWSRLAQMVQTEWFNWDATTMRLNYKPADRRE